MSIRPKFWKQFDSFLVILKFSVGVLVFIGFVGGLAWCGSTGCEGDREEARRVVEGAGYTKVEIGSAHAYACGRDDTNSNTFTAIAPNGRYVEGTVCCSTYGCRSGCALRFEK